MIIVLSTTVIEKRNVKRISQIGNQHCSVVQLMIYYSDLETQSNIVNNTSLTPFPAQNLMRYSDFVH